MVLRLLTPQKSAPFMGHGEEKSLPCLPLCSLFPCFNQDIVLFRAAPYLFREKVTLSAIAQDMIT